MINQLVDYKNRLIIGIIGLILITTLGCTNENRLDDDFDERDFIVAEQAISEYFPKDIHRIDSVQMLRADGERMTVGDQGTVQQFLQNIAVIQVEEISKQQGYSGFGFRFSFYAGEKEMFTLFPKSINGHKIIGSDELYQEMKRFWEMNEK